MFHDLETALNSHQGQVSEAGQREDSTTSRIILSDCSDDNHDDGAKSMDPNQSPIPSQCSPKVEVSSKDEDDCNFSATFTVHIKAKTKDMPDA